MDSKQEIIDGLLIWAIGFSQRVDRGEFNQDESAMAYGLLDMVIGTCLTVEHGVEDSVRIKPDGRSEYRDLEGNIFDLMKLRAELMVKHGYIPDGVRAYKKEASQ